MLRVTSGDRLCVYLGWAVVALVLSSGEMAESKTFVSSSKIKEIKRVVQQKQSAEDIRDALLLQGASLAERISARLREAGNIKCSFYDLLSGCLGSLEKSYISVSEEFATYDQAATSFLIRLNAGNKNIGLNELFVRAIYTSQISDQREFLRSLLADFRGSLSSHKADFSSGMSVGVSLVGSVASGLAVFLVIIQIRLMKRQDRMMTAQNSIANEQLEITRRQDETARMILAQKPDLRMVLNEEQQNLFWKGEMTSGVIPIDLNFRLFNFGNKPARDLYVHIRIPNAMQPIGQPISSASGSEQIEFENIKYTHWKGKLLGPSLPNRGMEVGKLSLRPPPNDYKIYWQVANEDGVFPLKSNEMGVFFVKIASSNESQNSSYK